VIDYMAKEVFSVEQVSKRIDENFTDEGNKKTLTIRYKGITDEAVIIQLSIKGPIKVVEKKLGMFPSAKGVVYSLAFSTTQQTITGAISAAAADLPKSEDIGEDIDEVLDLSEIDSEIKQIS